MPEATLNTSASLAADLIPLVIKDELLAIADKDTIFYDIADKVRLPEGEGRTVQFSRYERLPLPTAPLNEGETPPGTPLTVSAVQAVVDQWGAHCDLSDVGLMTVKHPLLRVAQDRLGTQFAELVDREIQRTLMAVTNVFFPPPKTSRANLAAGDNINTDVIRQVVANLRSAGAPRYERMAYMGVCDPFVIMDIQKDGNTGNSNQGLFSTAAQYSDITKLYNGEVGMWMGVRWKESNLIPILSRMANVGNAGTNVAVPTIGVAAGAGENGFSANTHVGVVVTLLDPTFGFETVISTNQDVTTNAVFCASVLIQAAAPAGIYGIYVSMEGVGAGTATPTLQRYVNHNAGSADTYVFFKSGSASGANRFVTQGTGPVAPPAPPAAGNVHITYVIGKSAFGCTELGKMQTTLTPAVASDSDPLIQRRRAGWKHMFKAVIKNSAFMVRIESTSNFS